MENASRERERERAGSSGRVNWFLGEEKHGEIGIRSVTWGGNCSRYFDGCARQR